MTDFSRQSGKETMQIECIELVNRAKLCWKANVMATIDMEPFAFAVAFQTGDLVGLSDMVSKSILFGISNFVKKYHLSLLTTYRKAA